jgi:hypothetical protein
MIQLPLNYLLIIIIIIINIFIFILIDIIKFECILYVHNNYLLL